MTTKSKRTIAMENRNKQKVDKITEQRSIPEDPTLPSRQDGMLEHTREPAPEQESLSVVTDNRYLHLPLEILLNITSYILYQEHSQQTLHAAALVSRSWHSAAVSFLYRRPYITGKSFKLFVATVCPSMNVYVRKQELANMVRVLDMGNLVHESRKSMTARLLGRLKEGLEEFRAPQTSFAYEHL